MKEVRLKAFFFLLGMFLIKTSYCQKRLDPGYIITLNGDTLSGFIDNRNKGKNPLTISFRREVNGQDVSYSPTGIKKFKVLDEVYESAVVTIDDNTVKDDELTFSKEFHPRVDTIFLRTLIEGEKSLFFYKDEKGREHFFIRQGSELERLVYKKYLVQVDGRRKLKTNKSFLGQLSLYFQNCQSLQSKLSQVQYNSKSLIDIFKYYYGCTDSQIEFQQKKENILTEFGIVAGLTSTKLNFYSNDYEYLVYADFVRSTDLSAGLFLNLVLPRNHRKWSVYNELLFNSYKFDGEYVASSDYETTNTKTTIAYSYIKLNNLLRYKFPVQNMFVYLNTGVSNGFAIKETNSKEEVRKAFSKVNVYNTTAINYSTMLEQGVILGLGSQFKKCSFEARYERGTGMSRTYGLRSITSRLHILVGYRF